ncbi:V/A-type H+-transporting ATPase subunit A [Amycolatopsis lexingtonensis]|uniref:V/A-type H+-transporting ATPase subunit A n=1 Tax=Amycolatopsis lexingtonensis TaxID=218822 RepID=A0ABR9HTD6_9PSEU|nr:V/A-type H+-transporting ATPase subunit A [Amycolatopsis lexingtonensis]
MAGPLVEVESGLPAAMYDLVTLGEDELPGEVVAIRDTVLTVQAYEYTGGLGPGQPAAPQGKPLSAKLGPGLLGGVFDGLLRPLSSAATWLAPGAYRRQAGRRWRFRPAVRSGDPVAAGDVLGEVLDAGPLPHRVLVPPGLPGPVGSIVAEGTYPPDAVVATVAGRPVPLTEDWPIRRPRPYRTRGRLTEPLHTGQRVTDLLYPLARGSTAAVPGGFGTGKTVLLQQLAKWSDADVIVYVGCGERGNEMAEVVAELFALTDPRTGGRLADRTVIIANTSNMPMMAREASIHTGVTVAEFFRDMGYHTVVIADSTSRWAEALREFSSRTGELPAEEGYPANLASALAAFYERAGSVTTLGGNPGSVTIVGAVSPPGGDFTEPVTAHTERFVRCRWTLDRDLAYARHYPAVSWSASFSRDAEAIGAWYAAAGDPEWVVRRGRIVSLLAEADRLSALTELIGVGALPGHERMVVLGGRLLREAVLQQSALSANDAYCAAEKTAALVEAVLAVIDRCQETVAAGVPATVVEELDFGPLVRVRDEAGPADTALAARRRDALFTELTGLK